MAYPRYRMSVRNDPSLNLMIEESAGEAENTEQNDTVRLNKRIDLNVFEHAHYEEDNHGV